MEEKDIVTEAKDFLKICEEAEADNRDRGKEDLKFGRLGEQWDEVIKQQRQAESRPCLTVNRCPAFIRQVVNDARQNKPSIKVRPVDSGADPDVAKILDGLIRNIEATSRADIAYDTAIDQACSINVGYIRVNVDYSCDDSFDMDIVIDRVADRFTVYEDPYATCADGSSWNCALVVEDIERTKYQEMYPGEEEVPFEADKKEDEDWFTENTVRVVEYWKRETITSEMLLLSNGQTTTKELYAQNAELFEAEGITVVKTKQIKSKKVTQYILNGKKVIKTTPWVGKYIPIIPVYGEEVWEGGRRHLFSLIHHAKSEQQRHNYWTSAATELVALAPRNPWIGPKGAFKSDPRWLTANNKSHAYLEYDGNQPPQRGNFSDIPAGALQEAAGAVDNMKAIIGLNDASLGARSNETSGRAIMARQREGDVSTFHFIDNLTRSIRQLGAIVLDLIPHVYNTQRIIRVLGEDGEPDTVPVNQKVTIAENGKVAPGAMQPNMKGIEKIFDLTTGKYDITVTAGPSFTSRREEAAYQMTEMLRNFPQAAPYVGDLYAKNLDWPGADEIAERLKAINPIIQQEKAKGQPQPPNPEEIKAKAEIESKQLDMQIKKVEAGADIQMKQADLQMKQMELQEKRIDMLNSRMPQGGTNVDEQQNKVLEGVQTALSGLAQSQNQLASMVQSIAGEHGKMMAQAISALPEAISSNSRPRTARMKRSDGSIAEIQIN